MEEELQEMRERFAAEVEEEEARREEAVARFHAEKGAPTTQEELRAWTQQALSIYSQIPRSGLAGRRLELDR